MLSICVYLGAKPGNNPRFREVTTILGHAIAESGHRLIYGGSSQGLMGLLANAALARGGLVTGIIPQNLIPQEKPLSTLDKLIVTDSMQERKYLMEQQADAFIVMPGGIGTLEEVFETWNAVKIGAIKKPIGFLNIDGFFDGLFSFITHCVKCEFLSPADAQIPKINIDPKCLLEDLLPSKAPV
jgi:uncharacterized protein (TIGR00730 family)